MIPRVSPYCLIQEQLWPSEWLILVACQMLNKTSRKNVDRVMPEFIKRWPRPESLVLASLEEIEDVIAPLGLKTRRAILLQKMADALILDQWKDPRELPGIGEYGARAWEIFCAGNLGSTRPIDGALSRYWEWCKVNQTFSIVEI